MPSYHQQPGLKDVALPWTTIHWLRRMAARHDYRVTRGAGTGLGNAAALLRALHARAEAHPEAVTDLLDRWLALDEEADQ